MKPDHWQQVEELFQKATELPAKERPAFLAAAAGHDPQLLAEIETLLTADEESGDFLEESAMPGRISEILGQASDAQSGSRIGAYRMLRKLGEGGMSQVYLAVRDDDEFQKLVALKVIRPGMDTEELLKRFRRERQILASLDHPNIARLLDGGTTENGLPYFVMEHIEGIPVDEYCDRARLSVEERIELFLKVGAAVHYAHQNLVVHRDLKAHNILVTADGEPKLLDFGIAKLLKPEQFPVPIEMTAASMRPMTPYYASPEQVQGKHITTASDVYSLGVLLYRLVTGHFPYRFQERTPAEVERLVLEQQPESASTAVLRVETERETTLSPEVVSEARRTQPEQLRRQLSGDLDNILLMALRKEPQRRYTSVEQFTEDLKRYLDGRPVLAHRDSLGYRASKFLRRNRVGVAIAAAFAGLLIGFFVLMALQATRIAQQRDQAQRERDRAEQVVTFLQDIFQLSDPLGQGGETITAREILDRGAERVSQELTGQPEVQATLMEAIGNVYRNLGLYDWAEPLLRRALEIRRQELGEEHLAVAQSLNNLGVLLRQKGDYSGAEPLFAQALDLRVDLLGENHQEVADSLNNLGKLEAEIGNFQLAEELYRRAVRVQRATRGNSSPELATQLMNLATLLTEMGDFSTAESLFREALAVRRRNFGEEHALVGESINDLAVFLAIRGDYQQAEPLFRESLAMRRRLLGADHPHLAESFNNLGRLLKENGDHKAAEPLYHEAIRIRRKELGDHPRVAQLINNLAVLQQDMGNLDAAEASFRDALAMRRKHLGNQHADIGVSLKGLGHLLVLKGQTDLAEPLLRDAVANLEAALPADHWRIGEARAFLGYCLTVQGRYGEAETLLLQGYQILSSTRGPDHRRAVYAQDRLIQLYEAWGRPQEAARYRALGSRPAPTDDSAPGI